MGLPKAVRFDEDLEQWVEEYLDNNGVKFAQLVNMAVAKFITEPHAIQLTPVDTRDFMSTAQKAFKRHEGALAKLK